MEHSNKHYNDYFLRVDQNSARAILDYAKEKIKTQDRARQSMPKEELEYSQGRTAELRYLVDLIRETKGIV